MVLDAQVCKVCTWAIKEDMLLIVRTVLAISADSELVRNVPYLTLCCVFPVPLNIQVVTRESESGESA